MNVPVLVIRIGGLRVGMLFKYAPENAAAIQRFVADEAYAAQPFPAGPVLSESLRADDPLQQRSYWLNLANPDFNGGLGPRGEALLPPFFQNLLPEGIFRRHVAQEAGIDPSDFFSLLAACGKDLPGNVSARWEDLDREALSALVTQGQDALEMTVWAEPFQGAISISGVQPKLGVNRGEDGRFIGRTSLGDTAVIAKLPTPEHPRMPEVEFLTMSLARASGIATCAFSLEPMAALQAPHRYDLGDEAQGRFLAVQRFDRSPQGRVHMEDFAQVLGQYPDHKYSQSYAAAAATLLALPGCGQPAVLELLRRIAFNDIVGNADMHLKNIALVYPDSKTAELAPAYDLVAHAVYQPVHGHALALVEGDGPHAPPSALDPTEPLLTPERLRRFCTLLGLQEMPAKAAIRAMVRSLVACAPAMIQQSGLTPAQKERLFKRIHQHEHVQSLMRRVPALRVEWAPKGSQRDLF